MVDDAGRTVEILDRWSGEVRAAQVFVAALGASGYPDADVIRSQGLEDWIGSHPRGFETLGGVVEIVVPDHLRSAVTKAHRYDPDLHPINPEMADHDSVAVAVAVVPARVGKPRDQAPAEWSVLLAERWILASLRNRPFCSLAEVNAEIRGLREKRHRKPFPKLPGSRRELFEPIDQPAGKPLPREPYEFAEWKPVTVHQDTQIRHILAYPFEFRVEPRDTMSRSRVFDKPLAVPDQFTDRGDCSKCPCRVFGCH